MARLGMAVIAACALALTACGDTHTTSTPASTATPTAAAPRIGDAIAFTRADNKQPIGTIRFLEIVALPAECLIDASGVATLAIHAEIESPGPLFLPEPDPFYTMRVVDAAGATQNVSNAVLQPRCKAAYPAIAPSQPGGKTAGWSFLQVRDANPTAVVYSPIVGEADSTINNLKFVTASPTSVTIKLPALTTPAPSPTAPPAAPATTPAPAAAPPAQGQPCHPGTDTWAQDSNGGQLRCVSAPTPKWVASAPFIGTRTPGQPCELGAAVAESPDGDVLICVGSQGQATWAPGP